MIEKPTYLRRVVGTIREETQVELLTYIREQQMRYNAELFHNEAYLTSRYHKSPAHVKNPGPRVYV